MSKLLVFGGTGFLGGRSVTIGADRGFTVTATRYRSAPTLLADAAATFVHCDITDRTSVDQLVDEAAPDLVVNAAYIQSGEMASVVCGDAAGWVAEACARSGSQLVHISTDLVFDGSLGRPYDEDAAPNPLSDYGAAKLRAETLVQAALPKAAILRTSLIYGDPSAPQETLVRRALDPYTSGASSIAFFTDEWRSPVHVDDLATAVFDVAERAADGAADARGVLHVAGAERVSRLRFAQLLARASGEDPELLQGRSQDPALGPRPADVSLDVSRAVRLGLTLPRVSDRLGKDGGGPVDSRPD